MKKISLAFLWHFHQPYYKSPISDEYIFPWVRLHAQKAYYDMGRILEEFPQIKMNFNFVPSLLLQLIEYEKSSPQDTFFRLTNKLPEELTAEEKILILENFFSANFENMINSYPEYLRLWEKRKYLQKNAQEHLHKFTSQEIFDLQVWFNLTWFGYFAQKDIPEIKDLMNKGKKFTPADKQKVIDIQREIIRRIIPLYKKLTQRGQVEITLSPFYHPILPLIYDTEIAKRSIPDISLPFQFSHPEDAKEQIKKAVDFYREVWGREPRGMWPSEGSVCEEIIPLLTDIKIYWFATDEDILYLSSSSDKSIYQPYVVGENIHSVFRDKNLSNKISFTYYLLTAEEATADFVGKLSDIARHTLEEKPLVVIALDGENPWENYAESGYKFISLLLQRLDSAPHIRTVKISEFIEENNPRACVQKIYSGSWINHNFGIWIGHEEDKRGWELLKKTRDFLVEYLDKNSVEEEIKKSLWEKIYIAEGSDWFWWWGDEFSSVQKDNFDILFRENLSYIYQKLKQEIPDFLLKDESISSHNTLPHSLISPIIDGRVSDFYEWGGAGRYQNKANLSNPSYVIKKIFYGFDRDNLYFRIDIAEEMFSKKDVKIKLFIQGREKFVLQFSPDKKSHLLQKVSWGEVVELCLPTEKIGVKLNDVIKFYTVLYLPDDLPCFCPYLGKICFKFLGEKVEEENWMV